MVPAIYFVFSRAGCDRSVRWIREAGISLTTRAEADHIRERAETRAAWIDEEDLVTLGFYDFLDGLTAGVAAHHAGMLPVFKETVEELFEAGLVKVVFATETLSLGINMPAKTVVIEDLWKFQGERHELLTPGEYTQLTGRAGRRGIDEVGHAVVLYQKQVDFERVADARAAPHLRPRLVVPALVQHGREPRPQLHRGAGAPPAQQLVRAVPGRSQGRRASSASVARDTEAIDGLPREHALPPRATSTSTGPCSARARRLREDDRKGHEKARADAVRSAVGRLKPGEVISVPERQAGRSRRDRERPRGQADRAHAGSAVLPAGRARLPGPAGRAHPHPAAAIGQRAQQPVPARRGGQARLAAGAAARRRPKHRADPKVEREAAKLEARAAAHPCHALPRARQARTVGEARRRASSVALGHRAAHPGAHRDARAPVRPGAVGAPRARLRARSGRSPTKGRSLSRIYGEGDILVAEALSRGIFDGLEPAEVAAVLSSVVYEGRERVPLLGRHAHRGDQGALRAAAAHLAADPPDRGRPPGAALPRAGGRVRRRPIFHWASGRPLEDVLAETDMAPGDFVRNCKQLARSAAPGRGGRPARDRGAVRPGPRVGAARRRRVHRGCSYDAATMTSPFGSLAVIADPAAGQGRVGERLPELRAGARGDRPRVRPARRRRARRRRAARHDGARRGVPLRGRRRRRRHRAGRRERDVPRRLADRRGRRCSGWSPPTPATTCCAASGCPTTSTAGCATCSGENTYPFDVMRITSHRPRRASGARGTRTTSRRSASGANVELARRRLPARLGDRRRRFLGFWRGYVGTTATGRARSATTRRPGKGRASTW